MNIIRNAFPFHGLRSRLFLLVLIAVLPALGIILYATAEQRQLAEADVRDSALRLARLVAADQERITEGTGQLLVTLGHLPAVLTGQAENCSALLGEMLKQYPQYANLGVAAPDGQVTCSAIPHPRVVSLKTEPYFELALGNQDLSTGGYSIDPITGRPALHFAYALRDPTGEPESVLFAALDLEWLNQIVTESQLPEDTVLVQADPQGIILVHRPDPGLWVGRPAQDAPLIKAMLKQQRGTAELPGMDGVTRLYAFSPINNGPEQQMFLGVGISKEAAYAGVNQLLLRHLSGLGAAFILALAAAWLGGDLFILRRVRDLLGVTQRLEHGDWSARTGQPYGMGELSQLARGFDEMAAALEQREKERLEAEQGIKRYSSNMAALNVAITTISDSLEIPEILDNVKQQMAENLNVPGGVIYFYDEEDQSLYLEAAWGVPSAVLADCKRFPVTSYHYARVIEDRSTYLLPDLAQAGRYAGTGLQAARPNWQGYLCIPLLAKGEIQGVMELFGQAPKGFDPDQVAFFTTLGQQVGVVIQNARFFAQVRHGRQRLQLLSQQLLEVQEHERRNISRELHDEIGQSLTALKVNLQAVLRLSGASTNSRYLEESISIVERILQQVRNLSLDLRPSLLDDLGVVAALRWYIDRQGRRAGFKTEFTASPPDLRLPSDVETVIFRVVQEALTNIIRHAVASHVQVSLVQHPMSLELIIKDDGIGFNPQAVRDRQSAPASLGLLGMQERVQLIEGKLEIQSDQDEGTRIRATFPFPAQPIPVHQPSEGAVR